MLYKLSAKIKWTENDFWKSYKLYLVFIMILLKPFDILGHSSQNLQDKVWTPKTVHIWWEKKFQKCIFISAENQWNMHKNDVILAC